MFEVRVSAFRIEIDDVIFDRYVVSILGCLSATDERQRVWLEQQEKQMPRPAIISCNKLSATSPQSAADHYNLTTQSKVEPLTTQPNAIT
jgi:hypothetical protein